MADAPARPAATSISRRWRTWLHTGSNQANARYGAVVLLLLTIFLVEGAGTEAADWIVALLTLILAIGTFRLTAATAHVPVYVVLVGLALVTLVLLGLTDALDPWRGMSYLAQFLLLGGLGVALLMGVVGRDRVDAQTIMGAIATYLLIGLSFGWLFQAVAVWDPDQFNIDPADAPEFSEFSFIVLTTVGFGNDYPTGALGGRLVVFEALMGQLFLATFIARLVALYGRRKEWVDIDGEATPGGPDGHGA
jgi:hypothetical protein